MSSPPPGRRPYAPVRSGILPTPADSILAPRWSFRQHMVLHSAVLQNPKPSTLSTPRADAGRPRLVVRCSQMRHLLGVAKVATRCKPYSCRPKDPKFQSSKPLAFPSPPSPTRPERVPFFRIDVAHRTGSNVRTASAGKVKLQGWVRLGSWAVGYRDRA